MTDDVVRPTKMRVGRFHIADFIIRDYARATAALAGIVVLHAEHSWHCARFEYVGICPEFDELDEGIDAPLYVAIMQSHDDGTTTRLRWERQ